MELSCPEFNKEIRNELENQGAVLDYMTKYANPQCYRFINRKQNDWLVSGRMEFGPRTWC